MCGSSAAKSYGSLGNSCAMRPPRRRNDRWLTAGSYSETCGKDKRPQRDQHSRTSARARRYTPARMPDSFDAVWRMAEEAVVAGDAETLDGVLRAHARVFRNERPKSWWNNTLHPEYHRGDARA